MMVKCDYCKKKDGKYLMEDTIKDYYFCSKDCIANKSIDVWHIKRIETSQINKGDEKE